MGQMPRLVALFGIFCLASVAWFVLAGLMELRTSEQEGALGSAVAELWGQPMVQAAPALAFAHEVWADEVETVTDARGQPVLDANGAAVTRTKRVLRKVEVPVSIDGTHATVDLRLDQRRKGLLWFSLYDVAFDARWTYTHARSESGALVVRFAFPNPDGIYDNFRFTVDGVERWDVAPQNGVVEVKIPVEPGRTVAFGAGYRSRGRDSFVYRPVPDWNVGQVRDLKLVLTTDFDRVDFPPQTLSPSSREAQDGGHALTWDFRRLVTGHGMGMVMPSRIQAGPLGSAMAVSAPLSLGLYMVWIYVLGVLKRIEVHPINHLFLAAAFFAFHLVFAYSADHLPVQAAFAVSAVTSLALTTSYLRLVVGPRFALLEAGVAQVLYLVGFSLAHFWQGYTGLTVTVLGVATLFALMQLTGRVRWAEVLATGTMPAPGPAAGPGAVSYPPAADAP